MKTLLKYSLILIIGLSLFTGCKQRGIPYTKSLQTSYDLTTEDLTQLQFYLSGEIHIEKADKSKLNKRFDKKGQLIISNKTSTNHIVIDEKTRGICVKVYDTDRLAISFFDDDSKRLIFGDLDGSGRYKLLANSWESGKGEIDFGGEKYFIMPGGSSAYLKFRMTRVKNSDLTLEVAKGKKVNN